MLKSLYLVLSILSIVSLFIFAFTGKPLWSELIDYNSFETVCRCIVLMVIHILPIFLLLKPE